MINGGLSIKGSYHDINQDNFLCKPFEYGYIIVVSDGMGSKKKSQYGSKVICDIIYEVISENNIDIEKVSFKDIIFICYQKWKKRVSKYGINQCYATLLVAVVLKDKVKAARLGDGFLGIYSDKGIKCLFDEKKECFINETDCFSEYFDRSKLETIEIEFKSLKGIIACTDGVEIGEMQKNELVEFTREFIEEYKYFSKEKILKDVESWLLDWPNSDDKTIAFLIGGDI